MLMRNKVWITVLGVKILPAGVMTLLVWDSVLGRMVVEPRSPGGRHKLDLWLAVVGRRPGSAAELDLRLVEVTLAGSSLSRTKLGRMVVEKRKKQGDYSLSLSLSVMSA